MVQRVAGILACMVLAWSASALEVVREGKACAIVVTPDAPAQSVALAARELVAHIEKASKVKLEIVPESRAAERKEDKIYLGATQAAKGLDLSKLTRNGFYIKSIGDHALVIAGRDVKSHWKNDSAEAGTRMGVSHWLDTRLGVRWLWPGELGTVVPKRREIVLPKLDLEFRQPLFSSRYSRAFPQMTGWKSRQAHDEFQEAELLWEHRHGFSWHIQTRNQHSMTNFHKRFFAAKPQIFNLLPDGTRRPDPYYFNGRPDLISKCVSDPELHEIIIADWLANRPKEPNVFVGESDTPGKCVCPNCLAWDGIGHDAERAAAAKKAFEAGDPGWYKALGNVSGRYARLYDTILKKAKAIDPNVQVIGLAYTNYIEGPPEGFKLSPDVIVSFTELMYPWTAEDIARTKEHYRNWSRTGASMAFRPNFMLDGHNMPIFFARKYHALHGFLRETGMISTYFDSNIGQYGAHGLNMYTVARMTMRPELSYDEIVSEYCGAFGAAAPEIREYFEYWEKLANSEVTLKAHDKATFQTFGADHGGYAQFYMLAPRIFTPECFQDGYAILKRASAKAASDPVALRRVDYLRKALRHAELTVAAELAYETQGRMKTALAVRELDRYRASIEADKISNMPWLFNRENDKWDRAGLYFMLDAPGKSLDSGWKFTFDPDDKGIAEGFFKVGYDDSKWSDIAVGTAWEEHEVGKAWKAAHGADYDGFAWYRAEFDVPAAAARSRSVLTFGAVDDSCKVYVNGELVLDRPYPYKGDRYSWQTPFTVDVTKFVRPGKNLLAVRVGDTIGAGGITKPVFFSCERTDSVVPNPGFETPNADWIARGAHRAFYDAENPKSGKYCYRVNADRTGIHGCWQRGIELKKGHTYRLKVAVRTSADFKGLVLVSLEQPVKRHATSKGTGGDWGGVEIADIKPDRDCAVDLHLCTIRDSRGLVWFDDVMLIDETEETEGK